MKERHWVNSALTSRERILAAAHLETPDTVPVCPRGVQPLRQIYGGEWPSASDMIRAGREFGFDCVLTWSPRERYHADAQVRRSKAAGDDGREVDETFLETPKGFLRRTGSGTRPMVAGAYASSLTSAAPGGGMVTTEQDLEVLESLYVPTEREDVEAFRVLEQEIGQGGVVQGEVANPVNLAVRDVGLENLMLMYKDDPEFARRVLAVYQRVALWQLKALLDAGAVVIYSDGVWCTTDLWSPEHLRQLIAPLMAEQAAVAHQSGALFHLFMDGNCMAALEIVADMGVDILSPLETPPSGDANVAEAKRRIGNRVCLWGGVNAYWDVMSAPRDHVRQAVRETIAAGAPGGGYVLSTADSIYEPCPLDNIRALFSAAREFGNYG